MTQGEKVPQSFQCRKALAVYYEGIVQDGIKSLFDNVYEIMNLAQSTSEEETENGVRPNASETRLKVLSRLEDMLRATAAMREVMESILRQCGLPVDSEDNSH